MARQVAFSEHDDLQRHQARVWALEAERLLDQIGVGAGWICADVGCGAVGILPELSRRAGPSGRVVGLERDPAVAEAARATAVEERLGNVEIVTADLDSHPLNQGTFDLVHLRFALHLVQPENAIAQMIALARPGGWVALQEPDLSTWRYLPELPEWRRLLAILSAAISHHGEPSIGRQVPAQMARAGIVDPRVRAVWLLLREGHPYMRLPLCWAATQREEILATGLASDSELGELVAALERHVDRPGVMMLTLTTIQTWGRTPR